MNGFLCIDKPRGPTSMDVIRLVRKALNMKKVGHSGTLDPEASGLLVVALGHATRLLNYLPLEPKTYEFDLVLGTATNTLDDAGEVTKSGGRIPPEEEFAQAIQKFVGPIAQTPPRFSALKINGVRAYKRARKNEEFEVPERTVTIECLEIIRFNQSEGRVSLVTKCSGGTYIRSLAQDIALALGTFGHASGIRRTIMGSLSLGDAIPLKDLDGTTANQVTPIFKALSNLPHIQAEEKQIGAIMQGRDVFFSTEVAETHRLFVYDACHELVAVTEKTDSGLYHPAKVFVQQ